MANVKILLRDQFPEKFFSGYDPDDTYTLALEYSSELPADKVCEDAFERFNIGEDEIAKQYRDANHRSLSVGDIVVLCADSEIAFICDRIGWKMVPNFKE